MHNTQFNPYLLPQFVVPQTYVPPYTAPGSCPLRWNPQEMQGLVRQDTLAPTPVYYASTPVPATPMPFEPPVSVRPQPPVVAPNGEEYFMGAEFQNRPTPTPVREQHLVPQTQTTIQQTQPKPREHALVTEVRTLKEYQKTAGTEPTQASPRTFRSRVGDGLKQWLHGQEKQADGFGHILVGSTKTVLNTPLTLIEGFGRGAIALTGGQVTYTGKSPAQRLGEGAGQIGKGFVQVVEGSSESTQGLGKAVIYAPLATLEVGARGVGIAAGATVAAGHATVQGLRWAGRHVADSSIGHEFSAGFRTIVPRRN